MISPVTSLPISIHAPREGSDRPHPRHRPAGRFISIHAPREGSDYIRFDCACFMYISIHAPREGSDQVAQEDTKAFSQFLSTLPVRGATAIGVERGQVEAFLSTLPVRGATRGSTVPLVLPAAISIHAPREGSDCPGRAWWCWLHNFYPRSP